MRFRVLLLFFVLISCKLLAQSDIHQLVKKLNDAKDLTAKADVYNEIFQYYVGTNPDSSRYYLELGKKYFTEHNFKKGIAYIYLLEGDIESSRGNLELAKQFKLESLKLYNEINDIKGICSIKNGLGTIEGKKGNFTNAIKYFLEALKGFESINNTPGIISTYLKLGVVNNINNNLTKSLEYYNKAITLSEKQTLNINTLYLYCNVGIVYFKTGDTKKAFYYFNKALNLSNDNEFVKVKVLALTNLGTSNSELGNEEVALDYFNKALAICSPENLPEDYARLLLNSANITFKKDPNAALASLDKALEVSKKIGQKTLGWEVLMNIINVYKSQKNYKDAFQASEVAMDLRDSIYNIEKDKEIANLQSVYELEKSNSKVQQLEIADKKNMQLRNVIILIACGLFFTLLSLYSYFLKSKRLNKELEEKSTDLQKANTVKDRLFSVIGHDLRGPMANIPLMLELYNDTDTTSKEKKFIFESIIENASISLGTLDKLLHWGKSQIKGITINQTDIRVNDNLNDILKLIKSLSNSKQISIVNKIKDDVQVYADPDHFNFIFRNLLANAVKFTHKNGLIEIKSNNNLKDKLIVFSVSDNGVGMDKDMQSNIFEQFNISTIGTANEKGDSLGLLLCREFVTENGGSIWVESIKGEGTTIYFSLKNSTKKLTDNNNISLELSGKDN